MPDDEIQVTPASSNEASQLQPSMSPSTKPGSGIRAPCRPDRPAPAPESVAEFVLVVLESQREQEEEHADLGRDLDEVLTDVELARYRPRPPPVRRAGRAGRRSCRAGRRAGRGCASASTTAPISMKVRATSDDPAAITRHHPRGRPPGRLACQVAASSGRSRPSPSAVPTATTTSPPASSKVGSGAGTVLVVTAEHGDDRGAGLACGARRRDRLPGDQGIDGSVIHSNTSPSIWACTSPSPARSRLAPSNRASYGCRRRRGATSSGRRRGRRRRRRPRRNSRRGALHHTDDRVRRGW